MISSCKRKKVDCPRKFLNMRYERSNRSERNTRRKLKFPTREGANNQAMTIKSANPSA